MSHSLQVLKKLRRKWLLAASIGLLLWFGFFSWLRTWWEHPNPLRWSLISGLALVYLLSILWHGLTDNHREGESELLPIFGLGNSISIARGYVMVLFCGFLFSPWPDSGWKAWLPGLLYILAALPDFVDGIAARLTNHVTKLGENLDISLDSLGMLGVSLLAIQYDQVPWWYLTVGLARHIFLMGIWLRQKRKLPVYDLPFSVRRRGYAALLMGLFFVILFPVFKPPGTYIVAAVFAIYIFGSFLWDWLVTIGWLAPQPGEKYLYLENIIVQYVPLCLRMVLLVWGLTTFTVDLPSEGGYLAMLGAVAALFLILGIAGRISAATGLVILGIYQAAAPLDSTQLGLLLLYANLLFLGTGAFSLWPIEDRLIFHRVGDPL